MEAVGTTFSIKEYTSTGVQEKYLTFAKGGGDSLLPDGIVDTVIFHLYESELYAAHAHVDALVEGHAPGMTRAKSSTCSAPRARTGNTSSCIQSAMRS